ncbi:ABC transporter substrate-binding protein [Sporomusa aerivorans]|uniref:ABC transporter substrate-binding protein n=1 Tax=Sporomusa aerivorans TaxID=204936 RepID=UPI00352B2749
MQGKKKKILYGVLSLFLVAILAVGCGKKTENGAMAEQQSGGYKEPFVLKVQSPTTAWGPSPYMVGEELGFFAEEGIKFEYVGVVPQPQIPASVVSGKLDVGQGHVNTTISAIAAGAKIKAVVGITETTPKYPHMIYITLENSPINSAQDLIGKKIGVPGKGGCHEYIPYVYMSRFGIDSPKGKVQFVNSPEPNLEQLLRQGDVDVIGMHNQTDVILAHGGLKYVFGDWEAFDGSNGGATPAYFSEKFIKEHPDVVRRYVRAYIKTLKWINENLDKAIDITAAKGNLKREFIRPTYFVSDGLIKEESVAPWIDIMTQFGEIKPGLKPEQIYTNEFNPNYKK